MSGATPASRSPSAARFRRVVVGGLLAVAVCAALALCTGAERIDVVGAVMGSASETDLVILRTLRLPRVAAAALVGAALGGSGVAFQGLLRNPLAEPYLLGLAGGGSLGAVLAIVATGAGAASALSVRMSGAFAGCLLALGAVWWIASRRDGLRPGPLLLAGVIANSFFLAGLACVQFLADPYQSQSILRWLLGGLESVSAREAWVLAAAVPALLAVLVAMSPSIDALAFGDETARSLGVDVDRTRRITFLAASALTAVCVATAGPIGFVGLVAPHALRLVLGSDTRILLPAAACAGAAFLAGADAIARTAAAPREIPAGVVTAVIGAPLFLILMLRRGDGPERAADV